MLDVELLTNRKSWPFWTKIGQYLIVRGRILASQAPHRQFYTVRIQVNVLNLQSQGRIPPRYGIAPGLFKVQSRVSSSFDWSSGTENAYSLTQS
jgi:hypothetical protein